MEEGEEVLGGGRRGRVAGVEGEGVGLGAVEERGEGPTVGGGPEGAVGGDIEEL